MPYFGFQLQKEILVLNFGVVIVVRLFCVILDSVIKLLAKVLVATFLKLSKPTLYFFNSLVNYNLEGVFLRNEVVDGSHKIREDIDS